MERTQNGFRLSSGREFSANQGIVGLARNVSGEWSVGEGYDGMLYDVLGDDFGDPEEAWTPAERRELADYMIALWQAFRAEHT